MIQILMNLIRLKPLNLNKYKPMITSVGLMQWLHSMPHGNLSMSWQMTGIIWPCSISQEMRRANLLQTKIQCLSNTATCKMQPAGSGLISLIKQESQCLSSWLNKDMMFGWATIAGQNTRATIQMVWLLTKKNSGPFLTNRWECMMFQQTSKR